MLQDRPGTLLPWPCPLSLLWELRSHRPRQPSLTTEGRQEASSPWTDLCALLHPWSQGCEWLCAGVGDTGRPREDLHQPLPETFRGPSGLGLHRVLGACWWV